MWVHVKAILVLVAATVLLCSVLYPLALLAVGQALFPSQASGSLVGGPGGKPVGSSQVAQPFTDDGYFQPRPSAVSYNAAASGGSNWGASNVKLRDRAARILGPVVRFHTADGLDGRGKSVQENIEEWFRAQEQPVLGWANAYPTLAASWVGLDPLNKAYVQRWVREHRADVERLWAADNPGKDFPDIEAKPEDWAVAFFKSFAAAHPRKWPVVIEERGPDGKPGKRLAPGDAGADLQATFFDPWLRAHPDAALEPVPADLVTASGSGLDPHITLANARYQARRVVAARVKQLAGANPSAEERGRLETRVKQAVDEALAQNAAAPLGGLVGGEPLVNVLEANLALDERMKGVAGR
jgi:K+-transporting ATPase ATPase C chain